jgi:hypothetical protein
MEYPVMNLVGDVGDDWRFKFIDPQYPNKYAYVLIPKILARHVSWGQPKDYGINKKYGGHYE